MDLSLRVEERGERTVVRVGGDVDIDTAASLRSLVTDLLDQGRRDLLVDVSAVDFIDSTGLGVLLGSLREAQRRDGVLELQCTQRRMLSLLRLVGLDAAFTVHEVDIAAAG